MRVPDQESRFVGPGTGREYLTRPGWLLVRDSIQTILFCVLDAGRPRSRLHEPTDCF